MSVTAYIKDGLAEEAYPRAMEIVRRQLQTHGQSPPPFAAHGRLRRKLILPPRVNADVRQVVTRLRTHLPVATTKITKTVIK